MDEFKVPLAWFYIGFLSAVILISYLATPNKNIKQGKQIQIGKDYYVCKVVAKEEKVRVG